MKILKAVSALFIYVALASNLQAADKKLENISIQLKWFYQYQFAGVFVAKEKGFYEDLGLNVEIKERDPKKNNILQVAQGESEYGIADSVILRYRAQGHDLKVIATVFQHNAMVLMSKKGSGIVSPYEMKGKKISFQEGLDDSIISSLLAFANIDDSEYIKEPMDYTHMDFVNGTVDISEAYISIEPYWLKEKYDIEVNIIDPKNYGIDFYGDLIFTTQREIDEHPLRVKKFKEATLRGWKYALEHQDEAIQIILDKYNTRGLNYNQLVYEARVTRSLIASNYIPLGDVRTERFKVLGKLYQGKNISAKKLSEAVESIVYKPDLKENIFFKYVYEIIAIGVLLLLLTLFLFFNNRRLKYLVNLQTKELEKSIETAQRATKAKSAFLANMSHEIRTPMNAILGFAEQLKKSEKDVQRKKILAIVENSGKNLLRIINDVLDISKIESEKMELDIQKSNIFTLIDDTQSLFLQLCEEKNIALKVNISDEVSTCLMFDDVRLKQILINILSNAVKFTPKEGEVSIEVAEKNKMLEILVRDTGMGIAKENFEKIFHSFEQEDSSTTRSFGGTGLGLSISEKLSKLMGGDILLESEVNKGSEFYILIPYIVCQNEDKAEELVEVKDDPGTLKTDAKVLIVEDNKTNQLLLAMILDAYSIRYEIANDGSEALGMFNKTEYDLIFMDENMPHMSGLEATVKIREKEEKQKLKRTPIVAVTANAFEEDREKFLKAGMDDYLAKPYHEDDIGKMLLKHL
ncbi:MAG: ABC transporter substrate-binding protein [Helicobacteraceae bacterium]|nr:ABC transporter substrate-binding protein [Candidatus Sulfurimonas ponti]